VTTSTILLQGIAAVTFGLAFIGQWRAFGRASAAIWAAAMLMYGTGSILAAAANFVSSDPAAPNQTAILLAFPAMALLFGGTGMFRIGTSVTAGAPAPRAGVVRYTAAWAIAGLVLVATIGIASRTGHPALAETLQLGGSRFAFATACALAIVPLVRAPRSERRVEFALLGVALGSSAVRFLVSAGSSLAGFGRDPGQPEAGGLAVAHLSVLILLGVAIAVVLVGEERVAALEAARTIRETAEALRSTENQLRFVIENSSDVPLLAGADRRIKFIGRASERLLGYPEQELVGTDLLELAHPEDRPKAEAAVANLFQAGNQPALPLAVRIRHRTGSWIPFEIRGRMVVDSERNPALVLSARDVTTVRRLESALLESQKLEALGQLAAEVAHDFNNILTAISGGAALARESVPVESPTSADLDVISHATERGSALTRQLLTFARRQAIAPVRFFVRARLQGLAAILRRLVGDMVELVVEPGQEDYAVSADPNQFDQVIVNLAANARDAMPNGGTLRFRVVLGSNGPGSHDGVRRVRIEADDTGPGIPPEVMARIFEPFFTTKGERGTGLGLATAYGFARQAGGDLRADSSPSGGARLILELPEA
jgi:PAS domain S-box-containing protein